MRLPRLSKGRAPIAETTPIASLRCACSRCCNCCPEGFGAPRFVPVLKSPVDLSVMHADG